MTKSQHNGTKREGHDQSPWEADTPPARTKQCFSLGDTKQSAPQSRKTWHTLVMPLYQHQSSTSPTHMVPETRRQQLHQCSDPCWIPLKISTFLISPLSAAARGKGRGQAPSPCPIPSVSAALLYFPLCGITGGPGRCEEGKGKLQWGKKSRRSRRGCHHSQQHLVTKTFKKVTSASVFFLPPHFPTNSSQLRSTRLVRENGAGRGKRFQSLIKVPHPYPKTSVSHCCVVPLSLSTCSTTLTLTKKNSP